MPVPRVRADFQELLKVICKELHEKVDSEGEIDFFSNLIRSEYWKKKKSDVKKKLFWIFHAFFSVIIFWCEKEEKEMYV